MYCKNLLKRQRQFKIVFYCKNYKRYIDYKVDCKNCSDFNLVRNKAINKVSKKRIVVSEETYNKVMQRDKCCKLCGTTLNLVEHHIVYKSEDRKLINEPTNLIVLCTKCHALVHSNKHYWQPILKEMIKNGRNG